jgi:hypothetical protein
MKAAALVVVLLAGCTQQLSESDCARYRDRLRSWTDKKGKLDPGAAETFMKNCVGATVSKKTASCLESATDEAAFVKCLD